jgi:hypothetical protein
VLSARIGSAAQASKICASKGFPEIFCPFPLVVIIRIIEKQFAEILKVGKNRFHVLAENEEL